MTTFLDNIDTEKVTNLLNETQKNSEYFNTITEQVVTAYTNDLDTLVKEIQNNINQKNIPTETLEDLMLRLSSLLYFMGTNLESVGIKEDIAKSMKQEVYNKSYLQNDVEYVNDSGKKVKPTKDAHVAFAEEKSKYENIIYTIYDRTYKIIKFKIESASELLSSLKKVFNRRIQETDFDRFQYNNIKENYGRN